MQRWGFKMNIPRFGVSQVPRLGYCIRNFKGDDENFPIVHSHLPAIHLHRAAGSLTIYSGCMSGVCRVGVDLFLWDASRVGLHERRWIPAIIIAEDGSGRSWMRAWACHQPTDVTKVRPRFRGFRLFAVLEAARSDQRCRGRCPIARITK